MFYRLKLTALLTISLTTVSILLFPNDASFKDYPVMQSLSHLEKNLIQIQKEDDNVLNVWREFQSMLIEEFATINYEQISDEEMKVLFEKIKHLAVPILKSVMKKSAKSLQGLTSYELYLLSSMVDSSMKAVKKGSIAYRFMNHMNKKLQGYEKTPFEYQRGDAEEIKSLHTIKLFSWNTCLLPGRLSQVFSGLSSWQDRIDQIVEKVRSQDADIICLQEVHSEPAARMLFESLKQSYAHFYMNMGPKVMASQLTDIGLNSGLFVASKLPLEDVHFEAFANLEGPQMINKGFFWAKIEDSEIGFTTSHLEPFDTEKSQNQRFEEFKYLTNYISSKSSLVKVVSGDLNIPWGSQEKAEMWLKTYFYDPYNKSRQDVSTHSRTFSDVFFEKKGKGSCEILDYFLILHNPGFEKFAFMTERVEGFDEVKLESYASDHHGLLSHIIFPAQK